MPNRPTHRVLSLILVILTALVVLSSLSVALVVRWNTPSKEDPNMNDQPAFIPEDPYLLLTNKDHPLPSTYEPDPVSVLPVDLTLHKKEIFLESTVAEAAEKLVRDLHKQGYTDIRITSGYRTYQYQVEVFNYYINVVEKDNHPHLSREEREKIVLTYSARPGQSEHQTGLCMDLISNATEKPVLDETFALNPAYEYLLAHAHEYGFILRYPKGKESVTKYTYEPWHYRYVGVETATKIHAEGLTLEEYLDAVVPAESTSIVPGDIPPAENAPEGHG